MDYIIFLYLNSEKLCNKVVNPEKVKIQIELTQNIKTFEQEHISSYPKGLSPFLLSSPKTQFRNSDSTFFVRHKPAIVWIMQFSIYQQILDKLFLTRQAIQWTKEIWQTMMYKTLHRKPNIKQYEHSV
jgi:hypothetical protein